MALEYKVGSTDKSISVFIQDASVTTGAGLTGLVYNSAGLSAYYVINNGTPTSISLATLASATAAHSDGGFVARDGTNQPGLYRLDLPDAVLATVGEVVVFLKGATNMVPTPKEFQVVANTAADIIALLPTALTAGGNMKVDVLAISGDTTAADNAEAFFDGTGYAGTNNVIPTVTTTTNVTTVNGLAANVITAAATASDFGTEIGTAVWATATRTLTAGTNIVLAKGTGVTGFTDIDAAGVRTAVGLASANLDTQLAALPTDADVSAAVWNAATASYGTAGTYGALVETNLDAAITSRMATYTQPTGFLAATFPSGTIANTTNITAGTITTATNVTTVNGLAANVITAAATAADFTTEIQAGLATSASIAALNNLSAAQVNAEVDQALLDVGLTTTITGRIDAAISTRLASASYTAPDNASIAAILVDTAEIGAAGAGLTALASAANLAIVDDIVDDIKAVTVKLDTAVELDGAVYRFTTNALEQAPSGGLDAAGVRAAVGLSSANLDTQLSTIDNVVDGIKAKTDSLTFTAAGQVDANAKSMNGAAILGNGTAGDLWRGS